MLDLEKPRAKPLRRWQFSLRGLMYLQALGLMVTLACVWLGRPIWSSGLSEDVPWGVWFEPRLAGLTSLKLLGVYEEQGAWCAVAWGRSLNLTPAAISWGPENKLRFQSPAPGAFDADLPAIGYCLAGVMLWPILFGYLRSRLLVPARVVYVLSGLCAIAWPWSFTVMLVDRFAGTASLAVSYVGGGGDVLHDQCDVMELNHFYDENGRHVFDQIIFYDWCEEDCRFNVCDWRLLKGPDQVPTRDRARGDFVTTWRDGDHLRRVRAGSYRETWTQQDPELLERQFLARELRRLLSRPPKR